MAMRYYAPLPGDGSDLGRQPGPHALRIGDAERDGAAEDLSEHYVAGRLTLDELNERLDAVFAAKTYGQLTRIMADLPTPRRLSWLTGLPGAQGPAECMPGWPGAMTDNPWAATVPGQGFQPHQRQQHSTPTDRAGRFAALALLLLAMLIWLFTALIFAMHGFYHQGGPPVPPFRYNGAP